MVEESRLSIDGWMPSAAAVQPRNCANRGTVLGTYRRGISDSSIVTDLKPLRRRSARTVALLF